MSCYLLHDVFCSYLQVASVVQRACEFVITFPRSVAARVSHGFNLTEKVNFCPNAWVSFRSMLEWVDCDYPGRLNIYSYLGSVAYLCPGLLNVPIWVSWIFVYRSVEYCYLGQLNILIWISWIFASGSVEYSYGGQLNILSWVGSIWVRWIFVSGLGERF